MKATFRFQTQVCRAARVAGPPAPGKALPQRVAWSRQQPLLSVLLGLRGRQLTLLAGGRELSGKLVTAEPLVLVDGQGEATLVELEQVDSVAY